MADLDHDLELLYSGKFLPMDEAESEFAKEPNLVECVAPIMIVGDIHGQFTDLMELMALVGRAPDTNFIFLGDFVDRGHHSVEVVTLCFVMRLRYPERVTLLRGNHESRSLTQVYGFSDECDVKYGTPDIWTRFASAFDCMPICALIEDQILCVHGGLSPEIDSLDLVSTIDRQREIPTEGAFCDLLWSDPEVRNGWSSSPRGAGHTFGGDITARFNRNNNLTLVARAHQVVMDGYHWGHDSQIVTLFSAPNYCYRHGNKAALLEIDDNLNASIIQFESSPHSENSISKLYDPRKRVKSRMHQILVYGGVPYFDGITNGHAMTKPAAADFSVPKDRIRTGSGSASAAVDAATGEEDAFAARDD